MRQVKRVLANYSADLFGICSALYELGGLIVMHDASGCNSTYHTHDEPRWYDIDSMIYVSGLTEYDAIMGNDTRLISDILEAADERYPAFIAVCGGPMPYLLGTDFQAIAEIIEKKSGIPTFGFRTNGMHTYVKGAGEALAAIAKRFCPPASSITRIKNEKDGRLSAAAYGKGAVLSVNLLGVTPLDFSVVGNAEALKSFFVSEGFRVIGTWTMGTSLSEMKKAGEADVNVVVSATGLPAAKVLYNTYGTPYVTGIPIGKAYSEELVAKMRTAVLGGYEKAGKNRASAECSFRSDQREDSKSEDRRCAVCKGEGNQKTSPDFARIIGEPVFASSLRKCLETDFGLDGIRLLCPTEGTEGLLRPGDVMTDEEEDIRELLSDGTRNILADPLFRRALKEDGKANFVDFPHEAYSGRMYRDRIPVFIGPGILPWLEERLKGLL